MARILHFVLFAGFMFSGSAATSCIRTHDGSCSTPEDDASSLLQNNAAFESFAAATSKDAAEGKLPSGSHWLRKFSNDAFLNTHSNLEAAAELAPRVTVKCGVIEGAWELPAVAAFRGIPYGASPAGKRRWRPATAASCWTGVLQAKSDGHSCCQDGASEDGCEDCLNLNVFTPQKQVHPTNGTHSKQTSLPVFFWIHGGANVCGSVSSYGPLENIVRRVPHVLVSVNYRLGIFGYLALKELSAADPRGVSGNYGITDQQLALKWVQANIEAFGGDRNSVTIIGQSSGGSNVFSHLASASSRGLFHRAIALSGSPNITMDRSTKESQDRDLILSRTRCAHETGEGVVDCLQNLSTSDAAAALPSRFQLFAPLYDYPNVKVGLKSREAALLYVDGKTITMTIEEALKSGLNDVPVLIQSTQAELDSYPVPALLNISEERLSDFFSKEFAPAYGPKMATRVHEMYQDFVNIDPEYAAYAVDSDTASSCGVRQLVMTAALGFSSPVYWGLVTGPPSKPVGNRRFPYHNWDVEAATGTYSDGYYPSSEDEAFGSRILHSWSDLATNGHLDKEQWTPAQKAAAGHAVGSLVEKKRTQPINDLKLSECAFWKSAGIAKNWWWIN